MTKKIEELEKVTLNLYPGDFSRLRDLYQDVPAGLVVRKLVRAHIEKVEGKTEVPKVEVDL